MVKSFWNGVAIAGLMLVPVSAQAAVAGAAVMGAPGAIAATQGASRAVESFYAGRRDAPLWFDGGRERPAASELVQILHRAPVDGLTSGPRLAAQIEQALGEARGDPRAIARAERMMSSAWVLYVQAVRAPTPGMIYGDPQMPASAPQASIILRDAARAPSLAAYLASVSAVNPTYSALRNAITQAQDSGAASPQLLANLERARAIPAAGRFVLVDAAAQRLWMYENGRPTDSMKVIVGKPQFATPMIASIIHWATLNPYWHVPDHLVRDLIAANVVKQGASYLTERGYEVVTDYSETAETLPSSSVDWNAVAAGRQTAKIRQLPGGNNSMGTVKFSFANGEGIYLHDTPDKALFDQEQRTLSNGCVRLEDAERFGQWLAGSALQTAAAIPEQHVRLPQGVPIYITYLTAKSAGGAMTYVDDIYGRDTQRSAKTAALK
ncbi:MAG: L,D-transpeptidase family protein [Pseudomonadota bacterium]|nr:L,D-transpeptidase family protein [Pseudomonadota bacterium]